MNKKNIPTKIPAPTPRAVKPLAFASFLNDFGSDIVYAIWPIFVVSLSGANMAILGLIDGLGDAVVSISKAISGYWSDRIKKRKVFIWVGYFLGALSRIGYAFAPAWQWLAPLKVLDRAGKIRSAPRDAIVATNRIFPTAGKISASSRLPITSARSPESFSPSASFLFWVTKNCFCLPRFLR